MSIPIPSLVWLCLFLLLASRLLLSWLRALNSSRRAAQLGCRPPPDWPLPWWDLFGLVPLRRTLAAGRQGTLPEWIRERHDIVRHAVGRPVSTYTVNNLGQSMIFTSDPRNVQALLATQFKDFGISAIRRKSFFPLLLNGIFVANGPKWEHARAILRPSFARDHISDLDMERRHNAHLLRAIKVRSDGWSETVDLQPLFFRLTIDTATEFLFGESVNSQLAALDGASATGAGDSILPEVDFTLAFDYSQNFIAQRARLGPAYWLGQGAEFNRAVKKCHDFIDYYVFSALKRHAGDKTQADGERYIFLDELVQRTQDPVEIRSQLINILLAGRDTTAGLLGFLFSLLARHPAVFAQLRRAIVDDFGAAAGDDDDAAAVSFAALKNCKYLQHCLNETLRLYPVVPLNGRQALRDTTLPTGGGPDGQSPVFVRAGQTIQYSVFVMHREPALWEDAAAFRPERWEGRRQGFSYVPFNAGPRICLGQQFALTSAAFTTVFLLQRFDAIESMMGDSEAIGQAVALTSRPSEGVRIKLHKAQA